MSSNHGYTVCVTAFPNHSIQKATIPFMQEVAQEHARTKLRKLIRCLKNQNARKGSRRSYITALNASEHACSITSIGQKGKSAVARCIPDLYVVQTRHIQIEQY